MLQRVLFLSLALVSVAFAQSGAVDPAARKCIDAGNQAWIDGMKRAEMSAVAGTYADNALDCGPAGDCEKGRTAIARRMQDRSAKLGRAMSASVTSEGSVQNGDFVYEWGHAEAAFATSKVGGRYLTVWQRQPDGSWKIFRNLSIPPDAAH